MQGRPIGHQPMSNVRARGPGPIVLDRVVTSSRPQVGVRSGRLGHMLNNKLIPNSLMLVNNRPKVKGSALIVRAMLHVPRGGVLCMSNRRDTQRLGLHTSHLSRISDSYFVIYRASLRRVCIRVGGAGPSLIVVSSVRAVSARAVRSSPKDVTRIERYSTSVLHFTGRARAPILLVKRVGGRKDVTNPGILRRVISAILRFRNSRRCVCHVLHDVGGHFNDATRLNVCRVQRSNLHRIDGPSRLLLDRSRRKVDKMTVTSTVRKMHPFLVRARTLMDSTICNGPRHSTAKFSVQEVGVLLTILRGHIKFGLTRGSMFLGVTKKLGIGSPTVSLTIVDTVLSSGVSATVRPRIYVTKRVNLSKRVHPIGQVRRHVKRTRGLNFGHFLLPGCGLRNVSAGGLGVRLIPMEGMRRTFETLFKWSASLYCLPCLFVVWDGGGRVVRRCRLHMLPRVTTGRRQLGRCLSRRGKLGLHGVGTAHVLGQDVSTHRQAVFIGLGVQTCVGRVPRRSRCRRAMCGDIRKGPRMVIINTNPNKLFTTLHLVRLKLHPIVMRHKGSIHRQGGSLTRVDERRAMGPRSGCDFKRKNTKTCSSKGLCAHDGGEKGMSGVFGMFYRRKTSATVLTSTRPRVKASGLPHIVRGVQGAVLGYNKRMRFQAEVSTLVVRGGRVGNVRAGAKGAFLNPIVLTAKRSTESICH